MSAAWKRSTADCCSARLTATRGLRAATCSRARWAICRTAASLLPTASAISSYGVSKTSRSTKTARSAGPSVSSTVSIAIETLSASSTSSATSGLVSSGSGSHTPTYVLAPPREGAQPVERLPGHDLDQVGAGVAHLAPVDVGPPQPGLLHDVLGVGREPSIS